MRSLNPLRWTSSTWVLLALLSLYLVQLAGAPLFDVDEGAFAEASREMLASGDWGHTTLNGNDRFDKPIFIYWCQAALMSIFGPHDWVARLPSALAILAALVAVWRFASTHWGEETGQRAGFMLANSLGLLAIGRAATADGMLNSLLVATSLTLWTFASTGSRTALLWAYAWCGLGLLTKGPVAALVPGVTLVVWSLFSDWGRTAWRAFWEPKGWMILSIIAAPWYLYALHRHGMAFVDGFFLKHNMQRFTGTLEGHSGNGLYYLAVLPLLVLPWSPWCLQLLSGIRQQWENPLKRFLWIWLLFVLAFFSLSGTKLPHYMLYGVTPMVLLMATQSTQTPHNRFWSSLMWGFATFACALAYSLPDIVAWGSNQTTDSWYQPLLASAPDGHILRSSAIAVALLGTALLLLLSRWPTWPRLMTYIWSVSMLWTCVAIPWLGVVLQEPFRHVARWANANHPEARIVQWQMHQPSFAFYFGHPTPQHAPTANDWVIARHDRLSGLTTEKYETVYSHRGLLLLRPIP